MKRLENRPTMPKSEVVSLLKELKPRFLEGLSTLEVASLVAAATMRRFPAHAIMAHEGYPANHLFLMIHGRAPSFCMTLQGEKVPIFWFPPGEVCGGAAFLSKPAAYLVRARKLR
jgi:CRP/FNR family transcriptional regulator, nitrogen oxide reductase regulator